MSSVARSTPGAPGGPQRGGGVEGQVATGGVDVEAEPDDDAGLGPLAEQAGELAVVVGRHEHVVGPLQRRHDAGDLLDRAVHGDAGEQRHPRGAGRRGRHQHRDRQGGAGGRRPRATEATAAGILRPRRPPRARCEGRARTSSFVEPRRSKTSTGPHGSPGVTDRSSSGPDPCISSTRARLGSEHVQERHPVHRRHRRPEGHRHLHDGGQARGPEAPGRRGRQRRLRARHREAARPGQEDRPRAPRDAARRGHRSSRWTSTPGTARWRSAATTTAPTATASSPATARSTAAPSRCSPRTSPSSAGRWARCSARRSSRSWTSR